MKSDFPKATLLDTHLRKLNSAIVGDEYELSIWLPKSFASSGQQYPTLYILDAPMVFGFTVQVVGGQMWTGMVPEMIIVGIGKHVDSFEEWYPIRSRDYEPIPYQDQPGSGQAVKFIEFIEKELIPFVDTNLPTDPSNRAIWGHSSGGTLVLLSLFNKPHLFNRYIATSPYLVREDGTVLIDYASTLAKDIPFSNNCLFSSVGSLEKTEGPHINAFIKHMKENSISGLDFKSATLEGHEHFSAAAPGFIKGLPAVFS